jgi:hypothetical protein
VRLKSSYQLLENLLDVVLLAPGSRLAAPLLCSRSSSKHLCLACREKVWSFVFINTFSHDVHSRAKANFPRSFWVQLGDRNPWHNPKSPLLMLHLPPVHNGIMDFDKWVFLLVSLPIECKRVSSSSQLLISDLMETPFLWNLTHPAGLKHLSWRALTRPLGLFSHPLLSPACYDTWIDSLWCSRVFPVYRCFFIHLSSSFPSDVKEAHFSVYCCMTVWPSILCCAVVHLVDSTIDWVSLGSSFGE